MHTLHPPKLETFDHWPSWLNARGHVDRSACFEIKVSEVRRLAGCIPMKTGPTGKVYRAKGRALHGVADLPNLRPARSGDGRLSVGWWDVSAFDLQYLLDGRNPRGLEGDWRTGRSPAMRPRNSAGHGGMSLEQGGYGPGQFAYERRDADFAEGLDAKLSGNPNRGACREKRFGLDDAWVQRLWLEKWERNGLFRFKYYLLCPGPGDAARRDVRTCADQPGVPDPSLRSGSALGGCDGDDAASLEPMSTSPRLSSVGRKGLKGLTGTTSNCGDGSRGAHGHGWVCGQKVYKLFWVLAREAEVRDALIAERWIAGLDSGQLARGSAQVAALVERYGPVMGVRALRCRRCLRLRYGQSPAVLRKKRRRGVNRDCPL